MKNMTKLGVFFLILFLVSGCNLVAGPIENIPTSAPVEVADTPGSPPADTLAPTPSATWTIAASDTPSNPMISVSMDTNCRRGQGQDFDYLGGLSVGETAEVFAKDTTGKYWYILNPDGAGYCWLWGEYATVVGDTGPLPVYTPEPTPTPVPDFTFAFDDIVQCVTMYSIKLLVTNTGEVPWESFQLFSRNTTLNISDTWSDNRFADCDACGCDTPATSIQPGQSNYVGSIASFLNHYPSGESFYVELMMCTQDGLAGLCLTKTLSFTVP